MRRFLAVCAAALLLPSRPAAAQGGVAIPDPASARVRLGPVYLNPTLALTNLGIDGNVFNEPIGADPKRDFTLTVEPRTDLWLRVGRTWITSQVGEQVVWYQTYAGERSANMRYQLGWSVPLNRIAFRIEGQWMNTRERPGFEIDARAQRRDKGVDGLAEVRISARTFVGIRGGRSVVEFEPDQRFLDQDLRLGLNRETRTAALTARLALTPLTSLSFDVARTGDRFAFSPARDSDSTKVTGSVTFDPLALLNGGAAIGYRRFQPVDPALPGFSGVTVAVDLAYVMLGATKFVVQASRDVNYSLDANQPYYVQTGANLSIAQQLFGPIDVVGRYGTFRLAYRDRAGVPVAAPDRTDHMKAYGAGIGYRLGQDLRVGVNIDRNERRSPIEDRRYAGIKMGTAITYGY
ncbi:MAG: outer membrane beta-barrel protein [Acidobacteria bacterium]|nr:outer membrane beta-barrel protein [Acidobacteriota bacterium]